MMGGVGQDIRFALRGFRRNPGFAAVAVGVLALAIGANTAIFSVVDAVVFRPLPFADPDRLVVIGESTTPGRPGRGSGSWPNFRDWRAQSQQIEGMVAYHWVASSLSGSSAPELVQGIASTANLFDVLGVRLALGRGFARGEDEPGHNRVVVLTDGLWRRRFGADPGIVGQTIEMNSARYRVIGVAPPGFTFPPNEHAADLWVPVPHGNLDHDRETRSLRQLQVFGRLAPHATLRGARDELQAIKARLAEQYPETSQRFKVLTAAPMGPDLVKNVRTALLLLLFAVACVLLIACANVANLLLARATVRRHEMAVRAALGAGRIRLLRQLLVESTLLGTFGAACGVALAAWGLQYVVALLPDNVPRPNQVAIDARVLAFTIGTSLVTSVVFGLAPALAAGRIDLHEALKSAGRRATAGGPRRRNRGQAWLLIAEVGLSFLLLVSAGLALRSFSRVTSVDPGFDPTGVLTAAIGLPDRYEGDRIDAFYDQLLPRVRGLPGVEGAAFAVPVPYSASNINLRFTVPDRALPSGGDDWGASTRFVSPGYFGVMGIPLVLGRDFGSNDGRDGTLPVAVVNESFVREHWPDGEAIGKHIDINVGFPGVRQIVGVVRDVKPRLDAASRPELYLPFSQPNAQIPLSYRTILVRAPNPESLAKTLQSEVQRLDRALPLGEIQTMSQRVSESLGSRRLSALVLTLFGALALLLAAAGIYAVMSCNVVQRTRELGIRMALGAARGRVLGQVLGQVLRLSLVGLALGLAAAIALTRIMRSYLFGISATDPTTFASLGGVLILVALLAGWLPARRATRVDPMVALQAE